MNSASGLRPAQDSRVGGGAKEEGEFGRLPQHPRASGFWEQKSVLISSPFILVSFSYLFSAWPLQLANVYLWGAKYYSTPIAR